MAEEQPQPGSGVDRTQIRDLLALPPAERVKMLVAESRNLRELLAKARVVR